jgi:hypothetical protein
MESKLQEVSGHPFVCKEIARECIKGYDKLFGADWKNSQLEPGKKIVVSPSLPSGAKPDYYVINTNESSEVIQKFVGADLNTAATRANEALDLLQAFQSASAHPCPEQKLPPPPKPCPDKEKYYDELFKSGELNATIVKGYTDYHQDNVSGFLAQQMFKTRKVQILVRENDRDLKNILAGLQSQGFKIDSQGPTEWHLSRAFFYKGEKKIARVHLFNSTVACAGDVRDHENEIERFDNAECDEQKAATARSLKAFTEALEKHQLVIYAGHSRYGHGPDFGPLGLSSGKFQIADGALDNISMAKKKTILFIDSCESLDYYQTGVAMKQKTLSNPDDLTFIGTTDDSLMPNVPEEANRLIQMVMEAKCPAEITAALNLPKQMGIPYRVEFAKPQTWQALRDSLKSRKSSARPTYKIVSDANGVRQCFVTDSQGNAQGDSVDDRLCADRYLWKTYNDKRSCYLADEYDRTIGSPVDPEFCSGE